MLNGKNILLAVCGSVAFYKAYELLSALKKEGANVRVVLSDGVLNFTKPLSFSAICDYPVLYSGAEDWQGGINHISYAKADLIIIAPATANTINCLANGIANTILLQTLIAATCPILIAPAANDKMLSNFSTQKSLKYLKKNGASIVEPVSKMLACKEIGKGALAPNEAIIYTAKRLISKDYFKNLKVLISGGATTENIDDVRAITNFSSGKMAKALADAFYYMGADVCLLASFEMTYVPYKVVGFKSSQDLMRSIKDIDTDLLVMCAAVSDFVPKNPQKGKIKKDGNSLNLELEQNIDILSSIKDKKCKKIGFKLETNEKKAKENAIKMLKNKNLDAVCLNVLKKHNEFGSQENTIEFITKDKDINLGRDTKVKLAEKIAILASEML